LEEESRREDRKDKWKISWESVCNESAYTFSGGKQRGNQGRNNFIRENPNQNFNGNNKGNRGVGNKGWRKFKGYCRYCGMQGTRQMIAQPRSRERMNQVEMKERTKRASVFYVGSLDISARIVQKENITIWPTKQDSL
jgi:hypothetical protein